MAYPSIEQYQIALQHPNTAFTDVELASGKIRSSNLGLPLVASGGFALTYALETGGRKYAVRCFHREAAGIERRYAAISSKLTALASSYFLKFEFQRAGVRVNKGAYPIVKMAWAQGETLGEFVESNHQDKAKLTNLITALTRLAAYLQANGIAHGDIQEGNLMVSDGGRTIQLIDYDGMFVPEIATLGGSELGHRDYQHPRRAISNFGPHLDRFSFIVLNLSLRALCARPSLWHTSQSGAGVIVCRANDFAALGQSSVLREIAQIPGLERDTQNFIAICGSECSAIPSLDDFVAGKNIPRFTASAIASTQPQRVGYISQYPVLDAADYALFHRHIGSMVELVGKIVDVKENTSYGRPYIFINFAHWKGKAVKIALWSNALQGAKHVPSKAWVGEWVTIRGLVEPVYTSAKHGYEHITITATSVTQISMLTEQEAKYRFATISWSASATSTSNSDALQMLMSSQPKGGTSARGSSLARTGANPPPLQQTPSANQLALQRMRQHAPSTSARTAGSSQAPPPAGIASAHTTVRHNSQHANTSLRTQNNALSNSKEKGLLAWLKDLFS